MRTPSDLEDAVAKTRMALLLYQGRPTIQNFLSLGRDLFLLKERVGHGKFQKCLNMLDLQTSRASRYMKVFSWFQGQRAEDLAERIAVPSKLIELVGTLTDGEMHALLRLEPVRGLGLADIEAMSCKDLRNHLQGMTKPKNAGSAREHVLSSDEQALLTAYRRCGSNNRNCVIGIVNLMADAEQQVNN